jgi:predicted transcriptional regulator
VIGLDNERIPHDMVVNEANRKFVLVDYGVIHDTVHFEKVYEKMVYVILCKYADYQSKSSYPSIKTIAEQCLCSENTVRAALKKLEKLGLISIETRKREKGGQTSNLYRLLPIPPHFPKYEYRPSHDVGEVLHEMNRGTS